LILLAGQHEERTSVLAYALRIKGYRVVTAPSSEEAETALLEAPCSKPYDLLLVLRPLDGGRSLLRRAPQIAPEIRTLLVVPFVATAAVDMDCIADIALCPGLCTNLAIIEAVRLLCARKPGPKPQV